jgi:hypothetical protein
VIELTAKLPNHNDATNPDKNDARGILKRWQIAKTDSVSG